MDDKTIKNNKQDAADSDTHDPKAQLLAHHIAPSTYTQNANRKSSNTQRYVGIALHWAWLGLSAVWRNVLWNRGFWTFAATIVMAVATALYTHYARRQLKAISDQLPELHKSAEAAKINAETAKNAFEMERRTAEERDEAVCHVEGDVAVGSDVFRTSINNSGNVTARRLSAHVEISLNKLPNNKRIRLLTSFDILPQDVPSRISLEHFDNMGTTRAEWEDIISTHDSLVETSTMQYDNGFDRVVTVPRCYVMVWIPSPNDPNNRVHGSGLDCERLAQWSESHIPQAKTH